jgi:hypothetical protein
VADYATPRTGAGAGHDRQPRIGADGAVPGAHPAGRGADTDAALVAGAGERALNATITLAIIRAAAVGPAAADLVGPASAGRDAPSG